MTVTISGTTGVSTPGVANSGNETITGTLAVAGAATAASLQVGGVATNVYPLVSGTAWTYSTNVTEIPFTNIPSWVKRITVMFSGVSTSATNVARVQLGTGATPTYVNSGYACSAAAIGSASTTAISAFTDSFPVSRSSIAADTISSIMTIVNITGTTWVVSANTRTSGNTVFSVVSGQVDAGAVVTALRITINGTDTFDAGSINILYE